MSPSPFAPIRYGEMQRVSEHVWLFRNTVNSAVVVGAEATAVVDTQINLPMARRLLAAARRVARAPVAYAVNTHYHWDHWAGNDVFRGVGARVISGALTRHFMAVKNARQRAFLEGRGFHLPSADPAPPDEGVEGERTIVLGGVDLVLAHLGRAETDDPTAVWVPQDRVAIAGDTLMTGSFPILGQPTQNEGLSEDRSWQRTLARLRALDPVAVLPGHGPLGSVADLDFFSGLLDWFLAAVRPHVERGLGVEDILRAVGPTVPEVYARMPVTWGTPDYAVLRAVRAMTGWQAAKPSALPAASPVERAAALEGLGEDPGDYREAALRLLGEGRPGAALAVADEAVRRLPARPEVWGLRARAYLEASRGVASVLERGDFYVEVRRSAERALELEADHGEALVLLGSYRATIAWRNGDDPSEAEALLARALALPLESREEAWARHALGLALRAREDEEGATASFRRALEADPGFLPARLALGPPSHG
ncbi:MAG: MBL fold metallo-hydrolase [Planctomycetes bacterium]|nr:MBL fold metallo-hydrolase [Planctomycetota bacterium]